MKFGRNRPRATGPHFRLARYLRATLSAMPPSCDFTAAAAPVLSQIYANDQLGDCVCAGAYHIVGVETGNAGALWTATDAQVISDYSAIGGYVPGDPNTDDGCDEVVALNYWQQHGFANGTKLLGWLAVNAADQAEVQAAQFLFENLFFGIELPDAWVNPEPTGSGFVWGDGTPNPENGHCVIGAGYDTTGVTIATWGMLGKITWPAIAHLCTPAAGGALYVMLSPDQLAKGVAKAPNGFAWQDLLADFDALGGSVPITPVPPVPPPPAPPGTPVRLAQAQGWATASLASHALWTRTSADAAINAALAANWPAS